MYLFFENFGGTIKQVRLYKDENYLSLVAIGQDVVGTITLEERNSSGLTGTVVWDGSPVVSQIIFTDNTILTCYDTLY